MMKCGICGEDWAVCIPNTVQGGEINLCRWHWDYLQTAQNRALNTLLTNYEEK
jgi:hypothetical protein